MEPLHWFRFRSATLEVHFHFHAFCNIFFVTFHFRFRSAALAVHGAGERAELGGSARPGAGCAVRAPGRGA